MDRIYLDNAATTRIAPEVIEAMMPAFTQDYGNPSSVHWFGREARKIVERGRADIAELLGCKKEEVYFTSGGTEADNWAIRGAALMGQKAGRTHIVTSSVEHHAVLHTCEQLEKEGFAVTYLPVDENGLISIDDVKAAVTEKTALVTVHFANNEIGVIYPVAEMAAAAHEKGALFHTDAVQAVGHVPINVEEMGIDLLSMSAHKFHGPKGVGALIMRKKARIQTMIYGGAHERGRRAGTENVAGIAGMAAALKLCVAEMPEESTRLTRLRDKLINGILEKIPDTRLNGHPSRRLPNNVNVSVRFIEGEALLLRLDLAGIAASSGSACTSGALDPSHVLLAIGLPHEIAHGSLRLSISRFTTEDEIDKTLEILPQVVHTLRQMSPLYVAN